MRVRVLAATLVCGCLVKPGPPADTPTDGATGDSTGDGNVITPMHCMPPPVQESFDDGSTGCGPEFQIASSSGSLMRQGGTVVFGIQGDAEYITCASTPFDAQLGVFIEIIVPSYTPGDMTYLALRSTATTNALYLAVYDNKLTSFDNAIQPQKTLDYGPQLSWWRLTPLPANTIRMDTSSDGKTWSMYDMLSDPGIDTTSPLIAEFGLIGSTASGDRTAIFDNFDVCPM